MDIAFVEVSLCLCKASAIFIIRRSDWYCHYHKNRENLARTFLPLPLMTSFYKVAGKEYHLNIYIYIYIYSRIKNAINANYLIIDEPLLLCNKDSQGVIINI